MCDLEEALLPERGNRLPQDGSADLELPRQKFFWRESIGQFTAVDHLFQKVLDPPMQEGVADWSKSLGHPKEVNKIYLIDTL